MLFVKYFLWFFICKKSKNTNFGQGNQRNSRVLILDLAGNNSNTTLDHSEFSLSAHIFLTINVLSLDLKNIPWSFDEVLWSVNFLWPLLLNSLCIDCKSILWAWRGSWSLFNSFWEYSLRTYGKFFEKLTFLAPWYAHVRVRTYRGDVRNVSFSENVAYLVNEWSLS